MFTSALIFASQCHINQTRKGNNLPYIVHPIAVASNVRKYTKEHTEKLEMLMTCALLHDVIEDCNVSVNTLEEKFAVFVASIVSELTSDTSQIAKIGKTAYLKEKMLNMSRDALFVKLCDRLDNIQDIVNLPEDEVLKYAKSTEAIIEYIESNRSGILSDHDIMSVINDITAYIYNIFNDHAEVLWSESSGTVTLEN